MNSRSVGDSREELVAKWLVEREYEILERNFQCKLGEIDIIAQKDNVIVFIEVKFRTSRSSGYAEEAVSKEKQRKICSTADFYRMINGITEQTGFRFDVIAITDGKLKHYENAFFYCGRF